MSSRKWENSRHFQQILSSGEWVNGVLLVEERNGKQPKYLLLAGGLSIFVPVRGPDGDGCVYMVHVLRVLRKGQVGAS